MDPGRNPGVPPSATVHLVSVDRDALLDVVERAEAVFLEYGVAPEVRRPVDLDVATAREYAAADPNTTAGDWLPSLSTEVVDAVAADLDGEAGDSAAEPDDSDVQLSHAGVTGMVVVDRLLREQTEGHPAVYLQSDSRSAGVATGYTVYRWAGVDGRYEQVCERQGIFEV